MTTKLIQLADDLWVEATVREENKPKQIASTTSKVNTTIDEIKPVLLKAAKPIVAVWEELNKDMQIEQAEVAKGTANASLIVKLTLKPKI